MGSAMINLEASEWFAPYANIRTDSYIMLASLLQRPPSEILLDILQNLHWDDAVPEKLDNALRLLRQVGPDYPIEALKSEFDKLFVGLGCGEMVPYASWYREKKIQAMPLASLRSDLVRLGVVRQKDSHESEDHAGALCEIMALISGKPDGLPGTAQKLFFQEHIAPWMGLFFDDLQSAKNAGFYRIVGLFGSCFLEYESQYLKCELATTQKEMTFHVGRRKG